MGAIPGSREPSPSGLGPSGFDPERVEAQISALIPGWDLAAMVLDSWADSFLSGGQTSKTLRLAAKDLRANRDKVLQSYVLNVGMFDAIATEARRAETVERGSVHEGAGPQDIARPTAQTTEQSK